MKNEIIALLLEHMIEIIFAVVSIVISTSLVPWLKEKKLYGTVRIAVNAAEKWSQNHEIDKKAWAEEQLAAAGIRTTPLISAMIESAVSELDIMLGKTKKKLL